MKLANYFNRQFTGHISTHEWDGNGPNDWLWTLEPLSLNNAGIVRMPMTDPMCHCSPKLLLSLNEIMEATTRGQCLIEWRLMGHTMAPLCQAVGGGLEHDCSTWDEIYENEDNEAANAWNAPSQAKGSNDRNVATAPVCQCSRAWHGDCPAAECQGHCQVIALSPAINLECPTIATVLQCEVYFGMLNGFLQWFAEHEILGFKVNDA